MRFYTALSRNYRDGMWAMKAFALKREAMDYARKEARIVDEDGEAENEVEVCRVDVRGLTKMGLAIALCSRCSDMTGYAAVGYEHVEQVTIFSNARGIGVGSL